MKPDTLVNPKLGVLSDVELPKWANGSTYKTLKILREALESSFVSSSLHNWIDLIFGYKQQGKKAQESMNVYHPITYLTSLIAQGGTEADEAIRSLLSESNHSYEALITQVQEFGQAPVQLFKEPHPKRVFTDQPHQLNGTTMDSLLTYPRSLYPWFVHILQHPHLQYSSTTIVSTTTNTTTASVPSPQIDPSNHLTSVIHETGEESILRFKRSELVSLQKANTFDLPTVLCVHESVYKPRTLLFGCEDGMVRRLQLDHPLRSCLPLPLSSVPLTALMSIDDDLTLVGDSRGELRITKITDSAHPTTFLSKESPHLDAIIAFTTPSTRKGHHIPFCSLSQDHLLGIWHVTPTGEPRLLHYLDQQLSCMSMEDCLLVTGSTHGEIKLWDLRCFHSGPLWVAEAYAQNGKQRLRFATCCIVSETLESFSLVGFSEERNNLKRSGGLGDYQGQYAWEALLCDARMLTPPRYPLSCAAEHSLTARYSWGEQTLLYCGTCDGQQWAIGAGVTQFTSPPIEETHNEASHAVNKEINNDALCSFASSVDLSYGFQSKQICRWPLLLTTPPEFMAPPSSWNINQKSKANLPLLWFADQYGTVELMY